MSKYESHRWPARPAVIAWAAACLLSTSHPASATGSGSGAAGGSGGGSAGGSGGGAAGGHSGGGGASGYSAGSNGTGGSGIGAGGKSSTASHAVSTAPPPAPAPAQKAAAPMPAPAPAPKLAGPPLSERREVKFPAGLTSTGGFGRPAPAFNERVQAPLSGVPLKVQDQTITQADRFALKKSYEERATTAAKAGRVAEEAYFRERAEAIRLKYTEAEYKNREGRHKTHDKVLPVTRTVLADGKPALKDGKPVEQDRHYLKLTPSKPPAGSVPDWHTHRYVVEPPKDGRYAANNGGVNPVQVVTVTRHYADEVAAQKKAEAMRTTTTPRATANALRNKGMPRLR